MPILDLHTMDVFSRSPEQTRRIGMRLGAALQAAWCVARREGRRTAKIDEFTAGAVAVDEATRCQPNRTNVGRYRELQAVQDALSAGLRGSGIFGRHRALAEGD